MMPLSLQDKCTFSLLGYCGGDLGCNGINAASENEKLLNLTNHQMYVHGTKNSSMWKNVRHSCGCYEIDGFYKHVKLASEHNDSWIQLVCSSSEITDRKKQLIPELDHMHWNGEIVSQLDLHVCKS